MVESEKMITSGRIHVCIMLLGNFGQSAQVLSLVWNKSSLQPWRKGWFSFWGGVGWSELLWWLFPQLPWAPGRGASSSNHRPRLWGSCWDVVSGIHFQHTGQVGLSVCPKYEGLLDLVRCHRQLEPKIWCSTCQPTSDPTSGHPQQCVIPPCPGSLLTESHHHFPFALSIWQLWKVAQAWSPCCHCRFVYII